MYISTYLIFSDKFSVNELHVPADTGLRYAGASGDYSPHHLYPWTARLLGYSKPMAHGMWTLSRAVATIQEGKPVKRVVCVLAQCWEKRGVCIVGLATQCYNIT